MPFYLFVMFYLLLLDFIFREKGRMEVEPIKRLAFFVVRMEIFWAGRIFSPELIKKFIVELFEHAGFFQW